MASGTTVSNPYERSRTSLLGWAAALLLGCLFVGYGVFLAQKHADSIARAYDAPGIGGIDFSMFYGGARLITSSDRANTYDRDTQVRAIFEVQHGREPSDREVAADAWSRYYNPPLFLLGLAPLTLLEVQEAYLVIVVLNVVLAAVLAATASRVVGGSLAGILLALGILSFKPIYDATFQGQPSILIAVMALVAFEAAERGRTSLAGLAVAVMGLKPQFLALPGLAILKARPRSVAPMFGFGLLLLALPFVVVGPQGVADFVAHALGRGSSDLDSSGHSWGLVNWAGFVRVASGEPPGALRWFVLGLPTLLLGLWVVLRSDLRTSFAAGLVTTLLVVPHIHIQDWVTLGAIAALLLGRNVPTSSKAVYATLFAGIWLVLNGIDGGFMREVSDEGRNLLFTVPMGFALLLWMALEPQAGRDVPADPPAEGPAAQAAPA